MRWPGLSCRPRLSSRSGRPRRQGYRVGRWARLALTVTVAAAAVVVSMALASSAAAPRMVDVTVAPGDTLWSIAGAGCARSGSARRHRGDQGRSTTSQASVLPVGVVLRVPVLDGVADTRRSARNLRPTRHVGLRFRSPAIYRQPLHLVLTLM